ncbi:hypothetical protein DFAR_200021 [Desulfarculales bacterium]
MVRREWEAACLRALAYGVFSFKSVERIIGKALDEAPLLAPAPESSPILRPNIRGAGYFLTTQVRSHADSTHFGQAPRPVDGWHA